MAARYEYKVLDHEVAQAEVPDILEFYNEDTNETGRLALEAILNHYGNQGWVVSAADIDEGTFILRRQVD